MHIQIFHQTQKNIKMLMIYILNILKKVQFVKTYKKASNKIYDLLRLKWTSSLDFYSKESFQIRNLHTFSLRVHFHQNSLFWQNRHCHNLLIICPIVKCSSNNGPIWTQKVPKEVQRCELPASIGVFCCTWTVVCQKFVQS